MDKQSGKLPQTNGEIVPLPAYPFHAQDIYRDLRARLSAELRQEMSFDRLANIIGQPKSTTHHWFEIYRHPHLLAFFTLLERLSPAARQIVINNHCRLMPYFDHPYLSFTPKTIGKLDELLNLSQGLTLLTGGTDAARTFLLTAIGHEYIRSRQNHPPPVGIDLHQPVQFVPVESLVYIHEAVRPNQGSQLILRHWPRILSSSASLWLFNRVWSAMPELRSDLLRCAKRKHVILAEAGLPDLSGLGHIRPIQVLTLRAAKRISSGYRLGFRRFK